MELDQIASQFRSAWKQQYAYREPTIRCVTLITDKPEEKSAGILRNVKRYLRILGDVEWRVLGKPDYQSVKTLLDNCLENPPDLIVTYRHLFYEEKGLHHSLGVYLDMLTQATDIPVLVLPHLNNKQYAEVLNNTSEVMVMTDHLAEDHRLVDFGVRLTAREGTLFLAHVESMSDYKRYLKVIGKIPELDTDIAENKIANQLLKEPRDFIESCRVQLADLPLTLSPLITFGHTVKTYRELIKKHRVDLLILNTKDDEQLAMHGEAYSIAVEFTDVPLLLL